MSANEASDAVALGNVPPEIREQLKDWMQTEDPSPSASSSAPVDGNTILSKATDDDGFITVESLKKALSALNSSIDAEAFAETASAEGELIRVDSNRWKRT